MTTERSPAPGGRRVRDRWRWLLRDRPTGWTSITVLAMSALALAPLDAASHQAALAATRPLFTVWTLVLMARRWQRARAESAHFWSDLTLAIAALLLASLLEPMLWQDDPCATIIRVIEALAMVALVRASDRFFLRRREPGSGDWPLATLLVCGLFLYAVLPAMFMPRQHGTNAHPAHLLFAAISAYLTLRFSFLAWRLEGHWRSVHGALAATLVLTFGYQLVRLLGGPARLADTLGYLPFVTLVVAARIPRPAVGSLRLEVAPLTRHTTVLALLVLPVMHLTGYGLLATFAPSLRPSREILVAVWLLVFGSIAMRDRRRLYRHARQLVGMRRALLASADTKSDLRVILERRRTHDTLHRSVEKYERAFDLCPDAIGISTAHDGCFLDINPAFEQLTGFGREAILGRSSIELGIWPDPRDRDSIVTAVRRHGGVRHLSLPFRTQEGTRRRGHFFAQPLTIDGEDCVIIVGRAVEAADETNLPGELPPPLTEAQEPVWLIDRQATPQALNPAAIDRLNTASSTSTLASLAFGDDPAAWAFFLRALHDRGIAHAPGVRALALGTGHALVVLSRRQLPR